jgi:hypothetical protein
MTKPLSITEPGVPLYLLPQAIAQLIRKKGDAVYRISVVRTRWHHYNISLRTKAARKELAMLAVTVVDGMPGAGMTRSRKTGRGCPA